MLWDVREVVVNKDKQNKTTKKQTTRQRDKHTIKNEGKKYRDKDVKDRFRVKI